MIIGLVRSSTINSTCPVVCNQKYGGKSDYVCHYNNHGITVCDTINNVYKKKQEKKNHFMKVCYMPIQKW